MNTSRSIRHLQRPSEVSPAADVATSDFLRLLNERHLSQFPGDTELSARIASYEMAARMQLSVPKIMDLSSESSATLRMYGADDSENKLKAAFARNCILDATDAGAGRLHCYLTHAFLWGDNLPQAALMLAGLVVFGCACQRRVGAAWTVVVPFVGFS